MKNENIINLAIEWDTINWRRVLPVWDKYISDNEIKLLEIGSRHGGLSLYYALKGIAVTCSDYGFPTKTAHESLRKLGGYIDSFCDFLFLKKWRYIGIYAAKKANN